MVYILTTLQDHSGQPGNISSPHKISDLEHKPALGKWVTLIYTHF